MVGKKLRGGEEKRQVDVVDEGGKTEIRSGAGGRRRNRVGKVVKSGRSKGREQRKARGDIWRAIKESVKKLWKREAQEIE